MARALIDAAADAGADAVKFQTYRADTTYAPNAGASEYLAAAGIDEPILDLFRDLEMPYELVPELAAYAAERGIEFMSSPFSLADLAAVDPHVRIHKVASFEISDTRLLEGVARTGKPVVVSTGASGPDDIETALEVLRENGAGPVCLLQCTSSYPAPPESLNLDVIPSLAGRFRLPVGLSDHSEDPVVAPVAAVAPPDGGALLFVALFLLGWGWNLGFVAGSALLTEGLSGDERARLQGATDAMIWSSAAAAALGSGIVVAVASYTALGLLGALLILVMRGSDQSARNIALVFTTVDFLVTNCIVAEVRYIGTSLDW